MDPSTTCKPEIDKPGDRSVRVRGVLPIVIICLIGLCFTLLVYSPGYMSWDSLDQLKQARAGVFKDNHPPLMAAIWSLVDRIYPGPLGMLVLQTTMFWGGLGLFFAYIRGPLVLRVIAIAAIGLYPPIFGLIGTIWKDLLMLSAIVMVLGLAMRFERRRGVVCGLALLLLIMIACGARHNAIVALPPLLVWLAHSFRFVRREKRWPTFWRAFAAACVASVAIYLANATISKRLTSVDSHVWQGLAVFDIAGISVQSDELLFPDDLVLTQNKLTQAYLERVFNSASASSLYRQPKGRSAVLQNRFKQVQDKERLDRLVTLWQNVILRHPTAYLAHRWAYFSHLVGWADAPVDTPIYGLYGPRIAKNDLGFVFHPSALNEKITDWLIRLSKTHVYRVWIYLIALIVYAVFGTIMYVKWRDPIPLALSSSGLIYEFAYLFFAGSSNFRYSLWPILATLLCAAYLLCRALACVEDRRHGRKAAAAPPASTPEPQTESADAVSSF